MMQEINSVALAKGALGLTAVYFALWLIGPLWFADGGIWYGLPLWFWLSCVLAPSLLSLAVWCWLREKRHG
ncbi:hypothetical protein [Ferrimonas pelagia]